MVVWFLSGSFPPATLISADLDPPPPPISDGAGEESTTVVGRRAGGLEELLTPPALDSVPEGCGGRGESNPAGI